MEIPFTKMQAAGNDYVYLDLFHLNLSGVDFGDLARKISVRHFSVGSDGLILIYPSETADVGMRMFNADGSEGSMCGNGVRCVAKYCYERGIVHKSRIAVETAAGVREVAVHVTNGKVQSCTVDMGKVSFTYADIPVNTSSDRLCLRAAGNDYPLIAVSVGNPHAVTFVESLKGDIAAAGAELACHPVFPEGANIEFVRVADPRRLEVRVWERGSGETYACGTGACASVAAAVRAGYCACGVPVSVHLRGGILTVTVGADLRVLLEGDAHMVFEGVFRYENQSQ